MSEQNNIGSPQPAPTNETSETQENKEILKHLTPRRSRLLHATVDAKFFLPSEDTITAEDINKLKQKKAENIDFRAVNGVSVDSRKEAWKDVKNEEGKELTFDEKKAKWSDSVKNWVEKNTQDDSPDLEKRKETLKAVGIDLEDNSKKLKDKIEDFRQKYVGDRKSDVKAFVKSVAEGCGEPPDIEKLTARLDSAKELLNVFGKNKSVNMLVEEYAMTRGILLQDESIKNAYAEQAKNITLTEPADMEAFDALAHKNMGITFSESIATPEQDTLKETIEKAKSEALVHDEYQEFKKQEVNLQQLLISRQISQEDFDKRFGEIQEKSQKGVIEAKNLEEFRQALEQLRVPEKTIQENIASYKDRFEKLLKDNKDPQFGIRIVKEQMDRGVFLINHHLLSKENEDNISEESEQFIKVITIEEDRRQIAEGIEKHALNPKQRKEYGDEISQLLELKRLNALDGNQQMQLSQLLAEEDKRNPVFENLDDLRSVLMQLNLPPETVEETIKVAQEKIPSQGVTTYKSKFRRDENNKLEFDLEADNKPAIQPDQPKEDINVKFIDFREQVRAAKEHDSESQDSSTATSENLTSSQDQLDHERATGEGMPEKQEQSMQAATISEPAAEQKTDAEAKTETADPQSAEKILSEEDKQAIHEKLNNAQAEALALSEYETLAAQKRELDAKPEEHEQNKEKYNDLSQQFMRGTVYFDSLEEFKEAVDHLKQTGEIDEAVARSFLEHRVEGSPPAENVSRKYVLITRKDNDNKLVFKADLLDIPKNQ